MADDWVTSAACVSCMSWLRLVFVLICCSTLENCTNSVVNEFASIGLDGSWFFSCVINRFRKSLKFDDRDDNGSVALPVVAEALADVVETGVMPDFLLYAVTSRSERSQDCKRKPRAKREISRTIA